jgi:hypothetical protein
LQLTKYFVCICVFWPPSWSSGQSSWLQIQRFGFDSRCYRIFWEVVGLERGPLSCEYNWGGIWKKMYRLRFRRREYGRRDPSRWPCGTFCPQKLALTSLTSGGRLVGIVRSRIQATEFLSLIYMCVFVRAHIKEALKTLQLESFVWPRKHIPAVQSHNHCTVYYFWHIMT